MKVFLDTSVFVAAMIDEHGHHAAARPWVDAVVGRELNGVAAAHSPAEVYAVLTRLQPEHRIPPKLAQRLVEANILAACELVTLTHDEYVEVLMDISRMGLVGGIIYDALLLRAARKAAVDLIVTFNKKHFALLNPGLADMIVSPLERGPDAA